MRMSVAKVGEVVRDYWLSLVVVAVLGVGCAVLLASRGSNAARRTDAVTAAMSNRTLVADSQAATRDAASQAAFERSVARDNARQHREDQAMAVQAGEGSASTSGSNSTTLPATQTTPQPVSNAGNGHAPIFSSLGQPPPYTPPATSPGPQVAPPALKPAPGVQAQTLGISEAKRAALDAERPANQNVVNHGIIGYPGGWSVKSVNVTGCDRLEAAIVECRVRSILIYSPDIGTGEFIPNVGGETCNTPYRVILHGRSTLRVSQPSAPQCGTWAWNTPAAPLP